MSQMKLESALSIQKLRVNNLSKPLGIDDYRLRFSWRLQSETRGAMPISSQVWVATSAELLDEGGADIWDSGRIVDSALHIDYRGPHLDGHKRYWWKVAVSEASGKCSVSEISFFDTGLFSSDWQAKWIWNSKQVQVNDFAYFRKEINLRQNVALAKIFVSAHNVMQLYVDGVRIGGMGSPAPTNPHKRKYYVAYDITDQLQRGKSCIAAVAHYLGGSGQNYVNGLPGFRLQLEVNYVDGSSQSFKTDTTWQTLKEIPHRTGTPYQQNRRISAIEDFDANKSESGWLKVGFDKVKCRNASAAKIGLREWPMSWQTIPEGSISERINPVKVNSLNDNSLRQVFDTGRIISGWPMIALKGIYGVTVRLRYSEGLDENGYVMHNVCNETSEHYYDQYTMRGDSSEIWEPNLSYKAFRYVEITGYPEALVPGENISIVSAHTDMAYEGGFNSSNELLNDMYAACIRTQTNNTLGQLTDCPHREQAQYLADSDLQVETLIYNFDAYPILEKVVGDFADGQKKDGTFPFVYPSNYENKDFDIQIPEWDLHYCTLLWKIYFIYGDERLLERYFEAAKRMADYYIGIIDLELGLVPIDKGWHISDWPYPSVDHSSSYLTVQNVKLYQAVRILAEIAVKFGYNQEVSTYNLVADLLKENIIKHLYDGKLKRFRDCLGSEQTHQGVGAIAAYYDLVPEEDRQELIAFTLSKPWESKTVLSLPLLRLWFENEQQEAGYRLINRAEYPGWGYMISQGASTMWEGWDDIESHSHAWNGYPARLLQEFVAGIRPLSPGFADVEIKPYIAEDLMFAEAKVTTVRGEIETRWERLADGARIRVMVRIPVTVNALIVIKLVGASESMYILESEEVIWEEERFIEGVSGIKGCVRTAAEFKISLQNGDYNFILGS